MKKLVNAVILTLVVFTLTSCTKPTIYREVVGHFLAVQEARDNGHLLTAVGEFRLASAKIEFLVTSGGLKRIGQVKINGKKVGESDPTSREARAIIYQYMEMYGYEPPKK